MLLLLDTLYIYTPVQLTEVYKSESIKILYAVG